jgi:hypothetical protein
MRHESIGNRAEGEATRASEGACGAGGKNMSNHFAEFELQIREEKNKIKELAAENQRLRELLKQFVGIVEANNPEYYRKKLDEAEAYLGHK